MLTSAPNSITSAEVLHSSHQKCCESNYLPMVTLLQIQGAICLFVTKAIHLEGMTSLSTAAFLAALRRFNSRPGRPRTIHSDSGTNFRGASNQMHHIYTMLQS
jgi:hypothetical protein